MQRSHHGRRLVPALGFLSCLLACPSAAWAEGRVVPAAFVDDRVFVVAPSANGPPLRFFTDTGSGWNAIAQGTATRLKLEEQGKVQLGVTEDTTRPLVGIPVALITAGVPVPGNDPFYRGGLVVIADRLLKEDGVLGARWFADHRWEIDYGQHTLKVLDKVAPADASHHTPLNFRSGDEGQRRLDFPRVTVTIDGAPVEMLLDTGATAMATAVSGPTFDVAAGTRIATSFVTKTMFERWVSKHPEWRVIAGADDAGRATFPMIEVPRVTIAGVAAGPVWFTQRPDTALHDIISQTTDQTVDGALGGSALRYFRVTLDYPGAVAYFEPIAPSKSR